MWPRHPIKRIRHRLLTDHFVSAVVVPGPIAPLRPLAAWLLENVHKLAERLCIPPIAVAGWHAGADPYEIVGAHHRWLERETCLGASVRFLLMHAPPAWDLMQRASRERRPVLYGSRASGGLHAFAFRPSRLRRLDLERLLADLTRCDDARGDGWATTPGAIVVDEASDPTARARPDAYGARRLNTALREVIERPSEDGVDGEDPDHLVRVLVAQRDRSAVPWIWNALANEVEHRAARPLLRSFPQEMHLSLTGRCNIECRFCSYSGFASESPPASIIGRLPQKSQKEPVSASSPCRCCGRSPRTERRGSFRLRATSCAL